MSVVVSVIVPVYNDPQGIAATLGALTEQAFPKSSYEIIVCDNGSVDDTRDVARRYQRNHPGLVRLVIEDQMQSSYAARNKGIANATGEILAFVDADMWMDEDWLSRVTSRMQDDDMDYLGCNVEILRLNRSRVAHYNAVFGFPVERYLREAHFAPTCCLVVRSSILEKVGLFDPSLMSGGDRLFGKQVHAAGIKQHFAADITLYHPARATLGSLTQKALRVGRGNYRLARHHPDTCDSVRLRLGSFLPVRPRAYLDSVEADNRAEQIPWFLHIIFYTLSCYTKWVRTVGYIGEATSLALKGTTA